MEYILSATIRIYNEPEEEHYKTEASVNINERIDPSTIDRDILLSLVVELDFLANEIMHQASITDDELEEFLDERKSEMIPDQKPIDDDFIDRIFDDED